MPVLIGFLCGAGFMGRVWLIASAFGRHCRGDPPERVEALPPTQLADEIENWLGQRSGRRRSDES